MKKGKHIISTDNNISEEAKETILAEYANDLYTEFEQVARFNTTGFITMKDVAELLHKGMNVADPEYEIPISNKVTGYLKRDVGKVTIIDSRMHPIEGMQYKIKTYDGWLSWKCFEWIYRGDVRIQ
jgi:hypothetical protein